MGPGDYESDVSSVSGYSDLTEANLATHELRFSEGGIAPPNSEVSEPNSETSESDADSEAGDDADSTSGSFYSPSSLQQPTSRSPSFSGDEVDGRASPESGFGSDAEKSAGTSRHRISASSPLKPGSFTLKSEFRPSAQGASAIKSVNLDRAIPKVLNGWVKIENADGKMSWKQMLMNVDGELEASKLKAVELTVPRRGKYHLLDVKTGAPKLPHPWADSWANSEWIEGNRLSREIAGKQIQAENTLMVGEAFDAAQLVGQQDADDAYFSE